MMTKNESALIALDDGAEERRKGRTDLGGDTEAELKVLREEPKNVGQLQGNMIIAASLLKRHTL